MVALSVNGTIHEVNVDPDTDLLWVLRDHIGLTGTKYGCGIKRCGACTVHVDGAAVRSCSVPLSGVAGKQITTIEGLAQNGALHKVQKAWLEHEVPQCGYCQCGMIMAGSVVVDVNPHHTEAHDPPNLPHIYPRGPRHQAIDAIKLAADPRKVRHG